MTATTRRRTTSAATSNNWLQHAACASEDPELFFPVGTTGPALDQIEDAKRVCAGCPVRQTCLDWALETGQYAGIWGGLSEQERRDLYRTRPDTAHELCIEQQAFIEAQLAAGRSQRSVAADLGVGHNAVCRAVRFFRSEQEAHGASGGEVAA